jgi:3,4-dihydroxy 2-butanone 4-phosphate synthase/GTP cyclohydrolase II
MARRPDLEEFAQKHDLKIGTIADLIHYRVMNEKTIKVIDSGKVQTDHGEFTLHTFQDTTEGRVHLALSKGDISANEETLVRVQVASSVRDMLGTQLPERSAGWNISRCIKRVSDEGRGVIVLLGANESEEDVLHDTNMALGKSTGPKINTSESDETYFTVGIGSQILRELGVGKIRLMGAPLKYAAISGFDLEVVDYENV